MKTKNEPCKVCEKRTREECSHVDCPNRKTITANVPDNVSSKGVGAGRYYRNRYQDK